MTLAVAALAIVALANLAALLFLAREWGRERAALIQRIQAPRHAVIEHYNAAQAPASPPAVEPDVDDDYWVSREELADRLGDAEVKSG